MKRQHPLEVVYNTWERSHIDSETFHGDFVYSPNNQHGMGLRYIYKDNGYRNSTDSRMDVKEMGSRREVTDVSSSLVSRYSNLWNGYYKYDADKVELFANVDYYWG